MEWKYAGKRWMDFSGGGNKEGLRPMSRRFTRREDISRENPWRCVSAGVHEEGCA
jgi:hypothetical protein